ncbi:hypothetical protein [Halococcus saccharolyticus]
MAESNPGLCADCGSELRNRLVPFE